MRLKSILIGLLISLMILIPGRVLAEEEGTIGKNKNTLEESQNKNKNLIFGDFFMNIYETLSLKDKKVKSYSTEITAGEAVYGKTMDILVTGYSSTPDQCWGDPFTTASGAKVHHGTMACPPEYAFGTKIEIEGMGNYVCEDRGGKIKCNHFDIWFESRGEALNWGKRTVSVKISY